MQFTSANSWAELKEGFFSSQKGASDQSHLEKNVE